MSGTSFEKWLGDAESGRLGSPAVLVQLGVGLDCGPIAVVIPSWPCRADQRCTACMIRSSSGISVGAWLPSLHRGIVAAAARGFRA